MSIETITHQGHVYPKFQSEGFAAQFARPFAAKLCQGRGLDIGCNRPGWALPGSIMIDPLIDPNSNAYQLPDELFDYIFSSHCLEHLPDWVAALDHWGTRLRPGGVLFLYLPHYDQTYWRPWNNRRHVSVLDHKHINDYLVDKNYKNIFVTPGYDLNHSFYAVAEKNN